MVCFTVQASIRAATAHTADATVSSAEPAPVLSHLPRAIASISLAAISRTTPHSRSLAFASPTGTTVIVHQRTCTPRPCLYVPLVIISGCNVAFVTALPRSVT
jgi:hypothetical protein